MKGITRRELFLKNLAQTSDFPLMLDIQRAEGVFLYDADGKKYMDLISGIAVSNLGHNHPKINEAIINQLNSHLHLLVYGEIVQGIQVDLAQAICETLPKEINNVFFVNSGSEAIEGAIKLAKRYNGRNEFISCFDSYHGSSIGALSVSGNENFKNKFRPLMPGVKHIRFGKTEDLSLISSKTAAVIIEPIQGEAGVRYAKPEYYQELELICRKKNVLIIADEIQSGFGRTGKFWAFEYFGFRPDIITMAKGMGGGMPLGAFASSQEIMSVFKNNPVLGHITTFGGHPLSCAASLATLKIIKEMDLEIQIKEKEALFHQKLKHPKLGELRSKGLMMALELGNFKYLKKTIDVCLEKGLLTDWFLFCDDSMRIAPPLTVSHEEINWACDVILESLD